MFYIIYLLLLLLLDCLFLIILQLSRCSRHQYKRLAKVTFLQYLCIALSRLTPWITSRCPVYNGNNRNNENNPFKSTGYKRTTPEREQEQREHADRRHNNATRDTRTRPRGHITHTHTRPREIFAREPNADTRRPPAPAPNKYF